MSIDLEDAWSDLHDAKPDGWYVGQAGLIRGGSTRSSRESPRLSSV